MTVFGPDISSYQAGLDLSRLADASFVIAKASEGTYYTDSAYQSWRRQAGQLGKPFLWYHFLTMEPVAAQIAHAKSCVDDLTLPGMLDVEPTGTSRPTVDQVLAFADAAKTVGLTVRLAYIPHWYWLELGSPSLAGLAERGIALVSSAYPGGTGSPTALYPGDGAAGWDGYGGATPALYQYTSQASDGGYSLDYNAFRGTLADFLALIGGTSMGGTIPATIGQKWPDVADQFPANQAFDDETALIWADAGARAAALYARQARDAATALQAQVSALSAKVGTPPAVDTAALAAAINLDGLGAAIAGHLAANPGASPDSIAVAVQAHLAAALAKA